jgi:hypothetical protein
MTTAQFNKAVQTTIDAKLASAASHPTAMPEFNFINVAITVSAPNAQEAYAKLCNGLAAIDADWQTDVYTHAEDVEGINERSTAELFPKV